jgi:hypothetical protein
MPTEVSSLSATSSNRSQAEPLQSSADITPYAQAEEEFQILLLQDDLDGLLERRPSLIQEFESVLERALALAYGLAAQTSPNEKVEAARLFTQRILYRIYRLKLFWFDSIRHYKNEDSDYLRRIRRLIETPWQAWEMSAMNIEALKAEPIEEALRRRTHEDLDPPPTNSQRRFASQATQAGYRRLLEIASLDGLVEASQLSRMLGGASNEIHAMLTRLIVEEYGGGQLRRKHSSYFAAMLTELGMNTTPEHYFDRVPWQVLASINQSFVLSERKVFYLRYIGGLTYFEICVPSAFRHYQQAAERLGLSVAAGGYWALHIREDERHGKWMLNDIALPLAARYPDDAWELLLGYDLQKRISDRAGSAVLASVWEAERQALAVA